MRKTQKGSNKIHQNKVKGSINNSEILFQKKRTKMKNKEIHHNILWIKIRFEISFEREN